MGIRAITRREAMRGIGLLGVGSVVASCVDGPSNAVRPADRVVIGRDGGPDGSIPGSCVLTANQAEGPFFIDTGLVRQDITEGRPGLPLAVRLQLVDLEDRCGPVSDATVELWHTDAGGVYSGFGTGDGNTADAQGTTFLRGFQRTDRAGRVEFRTVYPGWYPSRTAHVHVKVALAGSHEVTTQLYFDQARSDEVYAEPPYSDRGPQRIVNDEDTFRKSIPELTFDLAQEGELLVASYLIGISR